MPSCPSWERLRASVIRRKVFRLDGCLSQKWECGHHGLLQGCPLSPLLLAAVMSVWTTAAAKDPAVRLGVFVDDRTAWTNGANATTSLQKLLQVTEEVDALSGFRDNKSAFVESRSRACLTFSGLALPWMRNVDTGRPAPRQTRVKSGCWQSRFRLTPTGGRLGGHS